MRGTHRLNGDEAEPVATDASDELLIVNRAGLLGIVPALPCLFFGLPALAVAVGGVAVGHLSRHWPTILVALVVGVPMTYLGAGFLTYARCTSFDRARRGGTTWIRLVHAWQPHTFTLGKSSRLSVWQREGSWPRRYRVTLSTTGQSVLVYEHLRRGRVMDVATDVSRFLAIPIVDHCNGLR